VRALFPVLLAGLLPALLAVAGTLRADDDPIKGMEGTKVTVKMQSGKTYESVELKKMTPGKIAGTYVRLTIVNANSGKDVTLWAKTVKEVSTSDGTVQLQYDSVSKTLAPTDPDKLAEIQRLAKAAAHPVPVPKTRTKAKSRRGKRGAQDDDTPVDPKVEEAKRQEIFKKTGVWMWPTLSADQQTAEVAKRKEFIKKVTDTYPDWNLRTSETDYFLFVTNMPQAVAGKFTADLDRMYQELSGAFAIPKGKNVFAGKAVIFALSNEQSFLSFEQKFYQESPPSGTTGLCHKRNDDGSVVISVYCHTTPQELAATMVHETTHGFVHRYKSAQQIPSWLDEGMAEWVAQTVTNDPSIRTKQQQGMIVMMRQHNMGGDFYTVDHIHGFQYGMASLLTNFLIRSDPKAFREMFEQIKTGKEWRAALKSAYNLTPEELAQQFGLAMRIPNLGT
jgi:hypothetical protein